MVLSESLTAAPYLRDAAALRAMDDSEDQHGCTAVDSTGQVTGIRYHVFICHAGEHMPRCFSTSAGIACFAMSTALA